MLKITRFGDRLKVEGRLAGEFVGEFVRNAGKSDHLDLVDLDFVDHEGLKALREVLEAGARILEASPFVRAQLGLTGGV
jgi:hypothetical protein